MPPVVGSASVEFLDGQQQIYAATASTIFRGLQGSWLPVGAVYSADFRWRFALFGNDLIATDFIDPVQVAHGPSSTFVPLGGNPPRARIVETANNFVFLFNTEFATNQWWCSGIGTDSIWEPDIATQSANNILTETEGEITAAKKLGATVVAYKGRSIYVGRYFGPPTIWGFQLATSAAGTAGNESVVSLGDVHVFPGFADFHSFDGGTVRPLVMPSSVREFFFEDSLDVHNAKNIIGRWDRKREVVTWHYPSRGASPLGSLDQEIKWHVPTNKWTLKKRTIEYVMLPEMPTAGGITYDEFGQYFNAYGDMMALTYEDPLFAGAPTFEQAVFLPDHRLYLISGVPGRTSFLTGDLGDESTFTYIRRIKPKFARTPSTPPSLTEFYRTNLGDPVVQGEKKELFAQHWFNLRRRARFHRYLFEADGDYEIIGFEPDVIHGGVR